MSNTVYQYTPAGKQVMQQMVKEFGTRIAIDAITDYNIDFNNDGQISSVELTMLKRSINHRGKVDEKKLKENLDKLKNGGAIFRISTDIDDSKQRNVSYVSFKTNNYKYIEVEEMQKQTPEKRLSIHPDKIEIEDYHTGEIIKLERNKETEEKYLAGIDLDI